MKEIKGTDELFGDTVRIIIEKDGEVGVVITKYICREYDESMTFDDVLKVAEENGFTVGTFLVIVENPLRGIIYHYANCYDGEPIWFEYGTTQGYA